MRKWIVPLLLVHLGASQTGAYEVNEMVNIYASLRPEVIFRSAEGGDAVRRMDDGYSRVGLKGHVDLSETLWGYYKYERWVSANDGQDDGVVSADNTELREVHVGIGGRLGTLAIGRHYGLYYDVIDDELDRHRSHYSDAIVFGDLFVSNALLYLTPDRGPFQGGLLVELNDADRAGRIDRRARGDHGIDQGQGRGPAPQLRELAVPRRPLRRHGVLRRGIGKGGGRIPALRKIIREDRQALQRRRGLRSVAQRSPPTLGNEKGRRRGPRPG